jgi:predicted dehydrogenase
MVSSGFGRRWDWQTVSAYGGGTLNNNGVHSLDQALQLFGGAEPAVFCHLERTLTLGDAEDHVKVILHGSDGPMIDVELSSACAYPQPAWHVMGTCGGLQGSTSHLDWKYIEPDKLPERSVDVRPTPDRSYNREELVWREGSWDVSDYDGPGQSGFYLDLYQTIRHGDPLVVTPQSVRRVIRLLDECHQLSPV